MITYTNPRILSFLSWPVLSSLVLCHPAWVPDGEPMRTIQVDHPQEAHHDIRCNSMPDKKNNTDLKPATAAKATVENHMWFWLVNANICHLHTKNPFQIASQVKGFCGFGQHGRERCGVNHIQNLYDTKGSWKHACPINLNKLPRGPNAKQMAGWLSTHSAFWFQATSKGCRAHWATGSKQSLRNFANGHAMLTISKIAALVSQLYWRSHGFVRAQ